MTELQKNNLTKLEDYLGRSYLAEIRFASGAVIRNTYNKADPNDPDVLAEAVKEAGNDLTVEVDGFYIRRFWKGEIRFQLSANGRQVRTIDDARALVDAFTFLEGILNFMSFYEPAEFTAELSRAYSLQPAVS